MSSRVLGEETEKLRDQIELRELDGDEIITIEGRNNPEMEDQLRRSVIAVANSASSSEIIQNHILSEGVNILRIRSMGGLLHLITFDSMEEKEAMIECQWLQKWFLELRNVTNSSVGLWREVWLTIYGVPISAWGYRNFFDIGCIYGKVKSVEYSRLDCARVLIITDCLFTINNPVLLKIEDKTFKVFVSEDCNLYQPQEFPKPNDDSHAHPVVSGEEDSDQESGEKLQTRSEEEDKDTRSQSLLKSPRVTELGSPIDLGSDLRSSNNELSLTPNKTAVFYPPFNYSKPPKYPSPKLKLNFNSPGKSPSSQNSMGNLNRPLSSQIGQSLENLKISTPPSPKLSYQHLTKMGSVNSPPDSRKGSNPSLEYFNPPILSHKPSSPENPNLLNHTSSPQPNNSDLSLNYYNPTHYPGSADISQLNHQSSSQPNTQTLSQPKSISSSPTSSSPSVPPGFEAFIPSPLKLQREQKRLKKLQKRKRGKRSFSTHNQSLPPPPPPINQNERPSHGLIASEIIDLGLNLGMNFSGPLSDLHEKIMEILSRQEKDWESNQ